MDEAYKSTGTEGMTYDILNGLKFMECCIDETLRKYPIVPFHFREATQDYKIAESDLVIPKGTSVMIPVLGFQRDPEIFENPMEFKPERFLNSSNGEAKSKGAIYTPFGDGPRSCIGMRFGKFATRIGLLVILSKFNIELADKELINSELEMDPQHFNLAPAKLFNIRLTKR